MEIKCKQNPNYFGINQRPYQQEFTAKHECVQIPRVNEGIKADTYVKRPDAVKSAPGLLSFKDKFNLCLKKVANYCKAYKENIQHTYDHKIIFALVERELFGKNSIDSITHDSDKLIMYLLGFPKSVVSKIHRHISEHHVESKKTKNLRSMLCDNIASSPEFKPEKKYSLRDFYKVSNELQKVPGFKALLDRYNFGDNLDFSKIKAVRNSEYKGIKGLSSVAYKTLKMLFII